MTKTMTIWTVWETEEEYYEWRKSQKVSNTLEDIAYIECGDVRYDLEYDCEDGRTNIYYSEKDEDGDFETDDEFADYGITQSPTLTDFVQELVKLVM